jgi:ubiquitin-conjugating enzyme E2 T
MQKNIRIQKEFKDLNNEPLEGVGIFSIDDKMNNFTVQIVGQNDTPYEDGLFELNIYIPPKYPFEPPQINFKTPIYHPNIDKAGRICLDLLKSRPHGNWSPSINLKTLISSIKYLMVNPNVNDPLEIDIAELCKCNPNEFNRRASEQTKLYAKKCIMKGDLNNNNVIN